MYKESSKPENETEQSSKNDVKDDLVNGLDDDNDLMITDEDDEDDESFTNMNEGSQKSLIYFRE